MDAGKDKSVEGSSSDPRDLDSLPRAEALWQTFRYVRHISRPLLTIAILCTRYSAQKPPYILIKQIAMTVVDAHGSKDRPIIQVSLRDFKNRKQEIARDLWKAATEIGFFYLCDTGISEVR